MSPRPIVTIARLQHENEVLRDRVFQLETEFGINLEPPPPFDLTASEARVFGILLARDYCSKEQVMTALYAHQPRDEPDIKIVDVYVCKIRRKVEPVGVQIETVWGHGYKISKDMKNRAKSLIEQARNRATA